MPSVHEPRPENVVPQDMGMPALAIPGGLKMTLATCSPRRGFMSMVVRNTTRSRLPVLPTSTEHACKSNWGTAAELEIV